jgi:hypothetical protein
MVTLSLAYDWYLNFIKLKKLKNFIKFSMSIVLKIQNLLHLRSENHEIISKKSHLLGGFLVVLYQECAQIFVKNLVLNFLNFLWQIGFFSFDNVGRNYSTLSHIVFFYLKK